jgi:hypothetical protein
VRLQREETAPLEQKPAWFLLTALDYCLDSSPRLATIPRLGLAEFLSCLIKAEK